MKKTDGRDSHELSMNPLQLGAVGINLSGPATGLGGPFAGKGGWSQAILKDPSSGAKVGAAFGHVGSVADSVGGAVLDGNCNLRTVAKLTVPMRPCFLTPGINKISDGGVDSGYCSVISIRATSSGIQYVSRG